MLFCHFLDKTLPKNDMMLKISYLIFLLDAPFHIIYGKKNICIIYVYIIHMYINIFNGGSGYFALAVGSLSDGSSAKHSAIFFKMPKANHIKIIYLENILVAV